MEQHIRRLANRLSLLGYYWFEIEAIVVEASGSSVLDLNDHHKCAHIIGALEKYAALGAQFRSRYSK